MIVLFVLLYFDIIVIKIWPWGQYIQLLMSVLLLRIYERELVVNWAIVVLFLLAVLLPKYLFIFCPFFNFLVSALLLSCCSQWCFVQFFEVFQVQDPVFQGEPPWTAASIWYYWTFLRHRPYLKYISYILI